MVKKKIGKWRVCVDFTDLSRACPKDPFPMLQIDQLVDATVGHPWHWMIKRRQLSLPL